MLGLEELKLGGSYRSRGGSYCEIFERGTTQARPPQDEGAALHGEAAVPNYNSIYITNRAYIGVGTE